MSEKKLITKLTSVGNPITLLKMFKDVKAFIGNHQNGFPKNDLDDSVYFEISGTFYKVLGKEIEEATPISSGNIIIISESALNRLGIILDLKIDKNKDNLSQAYQALRRAKNIKRYKEIFEAIDEDFSTNVSVSKLGTIGFKTLFEKEG